VIFRNPAGAPELACEACGCRWFDRQENACYECGEPVGADAIAEYETALAAYQAEKGIEPPPDPALR
jgi:ribosomal protein L37E